MGFLDEYGSESGVKLVGVSIFDVAYLLGRLEG